MDAGHADARPLQRHPHQYGSHAHAAGEESDAQLLSFRIGSLFGRGRTRALVDSALPHAPIEGYREGRTAARNRRTQAGRASRGRSLCTASLSSPTLTLPRRA